MRLRGNLYSLHCGLVLSQALYCAVLYDGKTSSGRTNIWLSVAETGAT
jgi:hypothetical protein